MLPLPLPDVGSDVTCGGGGNTIEDNIKARNMFMSSVVSVCRTPVAWEEGMCEESCSPSGYDLWKERKMVSATSSFVLNLSTL